jgi:hypothetical protein
MMVLLLHIAACDLTTSLCTVLTAVVLLLMLTLLRLRRLMSLGQYYLVAMEGLY